MKRALFYALWLAALAATGTALLHHFMPRLPPSITSGMTHQQIALLFHFGGALTGAFLFLALAGLGWLPGTGKPPGAPIPWGWPQAIWMVIQFFTMQVAAQIICVALITAYHILATRVWHITPAGNFGTTVVVATAAGYLAAAAWSVWYIARLGPARLHDGSPTGIGWCAASWRGYAAAAACLVLIGLFEALLQHIWPPSATAIGANPIRQIFGTHGWKIAVLFVVAAGIAPFIEELVFRGGVFSAIATRFGAIAAAAVSSLLFSVAHYQEFAHYLPGLTVILVIAIMLAVLRIRTRSIRPGILLHILFNGISVLAMASGAVH